MEISDENLRILSGYLQQTLSPDAEIRRPGKKTATQYKSNCFHIFVL